MPGHAAPPGANEERRDDGSRSGEISARAFAPRPTDCAIRFSIALGQGVGVGPSVASADARSSGSLETALEVETLSGYKGWASLAVDALRRLVM